MKPLDSNLVSFNLIILITCIISSTAAKTINGFDDEVNTNGDKQMLTLIKSLFMNQKPTPRLTLDFLADPALFVSILHALEVAYWSMPLGFLLMPIINLFRMPNRRQWKSLLMLSRSLRRNDLNRYQENLIKAMVRYSTDDDNSRNQIAILLRNIGIN